MAGQAWSSKSRALQVYTLIAFTKEEIQMEEINQLPRRPYGTDTTGSLQHLGKIKV
jgi:hypothetical protein